MLNLRMVEYLREINILIYIYIFGAEASRVGTQRLWGHIESPFGRLSFHMSAYSIKGKYVQFLSAATVLGVLVSKNVLPLPNYLA